MNPTDQRCPLVGRGESLKHQVNKLDRRLAFILSPALNESLAVDKGSPLIPCARGTVCDETNEKSGNANNFTAASD